MSNMRKQISLLSRKTIQRLIKGAEVRSLSKLLSEKQERPPTMKSPPFPTDTTLNVRNAKVMTSISELNSHFKFSFLLKFSMKNINVATKISEQSVITLFKNLLQKQHQSWIQIEHTVFPG